MAQLQQVWGRLFRGGKIRRSGWDYWIERRDEETLQRCDTGESTYPNIKDEDLLADDWEYEDQVCPTCKRPL